MERVFPLDRQKRGQPALRSSDPFDWATDLTVVLVQLGFLVGQLLRQRITFFGMMVGCRRGDASGRLTPKFTSLLKHSRRGSRIEGSAWLLLHLEKLFPALHSDLENS